MASDNMNCDVVGVGHANKRGDRTHVDCWKVQLCYTRGICADTGTPLGRFEVVFVESFDAETDMHRGDSEHDYSHPSDDGMLELDSHPQLLAPPRKNVEYRLRLCFATTHRRRCIAIAKRRR